MNRHGLTPRSKRHYLYQTWLDIRKRCYLPTTHSYPRYGGRGIGMWEPWRSDAGAFADWVLANLGERPVGGTIDRIDNDGDYVPGNLRWSTMRGQHLNKTQRGPGASGVRGIVITETAAGTRYRARRTEGGQTVNVGTFDTLDAAIAARDRTA